MDKKEENFNIIIANDDQDPSPDKQRLSRLSPSTINNLFGDEYDKKISLLKTMEEDTKKYFREVENKLLEKFREFNINIENYFIKLSNKLSEAFGIDIKKIDEETSKLIQNNTKKYFDKLERMKDIHEKILESIKMEISILINSLDISKNLDKDKPIRNFLEKEFDNIIKSWLFEKLDFENFNFMKNINNSSISSDYKEFLYKACQRKNFVMNIDPTKESNNDLNQYDYGAIQSTDSDMINNNYKNLTKMKINKIRLIDDNFKLIEDFPKLRYLKFNNCSFPERRDEEQNKEKFIIGKCSKLEKLIINGVANFQSKMLENFSQNLTKLILSNNNFVNSDFKNIMQNYIINSSALRNNIEFLSFSNNSISKIDLSSIVYLPKHKFSALKELDFHKNRITFFEFSPDLFPVLKVINCCHNKFAKNNFLGINKIIALLSGNLFLLEQIKCQEYYNKLEKQLNAQVKEDEISLQNLTISYLPNEFSKKYLEEIVINNNILINLRKLNLSYNNLTCDSLFTFINNNKGCINLRDLNLCGNKLDDTFFEKYLENNYHNIFTNLKKINLSDNLIGNSCTINIEDLGEVVEVREDRIIDVFKLRLIYKFIEKNKNLSKLYLTRNPMSFRSAIISTSKDVNIEEILKTIPRDQNQNIIINSFYTFLKKISDELLKNKEEKNNNRGQFNIRFDIDTQINLNSENFNFYEKYIMFN